MKIAAPEDVYIGGSQDRKFCREGGSGVDMNMFYIAQYKKENNQLPI